MPDQSDLAHAEEYLRNLEKVVPEEDKPSLDAVSGLLAELQGDDAQVVYRCGTHASPEECEIANFKAFLEWVAGRTHMNTDPEVLARQYVERGGSHKDCHV